MVEGRWADDEHLRFLAGSMSELFRNHVTWKGLEKSGESRQKQKRQPGTLPCPEVFHQVGQNRKGAQEAQKPGINGTIRHRERNTLKFQDRFHYRQYSL